MTTPLPPPPRVETGGPSSVAADLLSEVGASCCPSLTAFVERLIDRQAMAGAGR